MSSASPAPEGVIKHDAPPGALEASTSSYKGNSWRLDSTFRSFQTYILILLIVFLISKLGDVHLKGKKSNKL